MTLFCSPLFQLFLRMSSCYIQDEVECIRMREMIEARENRSLPEHWNEPMFRFFFHCYALTSGMRGNSYNEQDEKCQKKSDIALYRMYSS